MTLDHQYHFGKVSELSHRQVWFFGQGLSYAIDNSEYSKIKYVFINLSIGREFNISPKIGLSFDLGLSRVLMEDETVKKPEEKPWLDIPLKYFFALPVARLQLNYSL